LFQLPKQDLSLKYCQHVSTKDQVTNMPLSNVWREMGLSFVYILVAWHVSAFSLPPGDVILGQLARPLDNIIFGLLVA
jgi:hypothetical protein